jgi:putative glutamine amidotransferase
MSLPPASSLDDLSCNPAAEAGLATHAFAPPLLIGISARIHYPEAIHAAFGTALGGVYTKTLHYLEQSVANWVLSGHAMAVMVPAVTADSLITRSDLDLTHYAQALDGLVLQGGNDVAPENYGETPLQPAWCGDAVRDRYETELVRAFIAAGKPVFGVCRGLQLLNVMHGGSLLQDIATLRPDALAHREADRYERHYHAVEFVPGTHLARLYPGLRRATTNSIHHQGIKDLAPGFVVEARCPDDGMIEAIRCSGPAWVAAVQWHPEFHAEQLACADPQQAPDTLDDRPMLADFLAAARAARPARVSAS